MDVSFQPTTGQNQQTTKTVQAINPADALKKAMQGMNPAQMGPITINTSAPGAPGAAPGMAPGPGQANTPNLPQRGPVQNPFESISPKDCSLAGCGEPEEEMEEEPNYPILSRLASRPARSEMKVVVFPFRIMLPNSFQSVIEQINDAIPDVKMIIENNRSGLVVESETDLCAITNQLDEMKSAKAKMVLENLMRAVT